jgi:hypothetical protein
MAHFAQLYGKSTVLRVIVVGNDSIHNLPFPESEPIGISFCQSLFGSASEWRQTSYNGNFRKNYAGVGFTYDAGRDAFIPPQPFESWVLDETSCQWNPPIPYPLDDEYYVWDETTQSWVKEPQ